MAEDLTLRCSECGIAFIWTVIEQAQGARPSLCTGCRRLAPAPGRARGTVKWYSRTKGYGFITPTTGPELFVHKSGLAAGQHAPRPGQLVEFLVRSGPRGAQAGEVVVLSMPGGKESEAPSTG